MKEKKILNKYITYISLFILCFIDSSFLFANINNGVIVISINILAIIIFMLNKKINKIKKSKFIFLLLTICTITASGLIFGNIKQTIILIILITIAFLATSILDFEEFKNKYLDLMFFLALYSLVCFLISSIYPEIILKFPVVTRSSVSQGVILDYAYHNLFFSIVSTNKYLNRNFGFFWEPGAYSIFLNIALLFEISKDKPSNKRILVFLLSIVTTFSTLGIICCILLIIYFMIRSKSNNRTIRNLKTLIFIISIGVIIYLIQDGDYFIYHVFGKLQKTSLNSYSSTTTTRYNALMIPMWEFLKNPITGIGYNKYIIMQLQECSNMATCTFANWLCIYGILGFFPIIYCMKLFTKFGNKILPKLLLVIFGGILFSTENFLQITFIYILMFYGFDITSKKVIK